METKRVNVWKLKVYFAKDDCLVLFGDLQTLKTLQTNLRTVSYVRHVSRDNVEYTINSTRVLYTALLEEIDLR